MKEFCEWVELHLCECRGAFQLTFAMSIDFFLLWFVFLLRNSNVINFLFFWLWIYSLLLCVFFICILLTWGSLDWTLRRVCGLWCFAIIPWQFFFRLRLTFHQFLNLLVLLLYLVKPTNTAILVIFHNWIYSGRKTCFLDVQLHLLKSAVHYLWYKLVRWHDITPSRKRTFTRFCIARKLGIKNWYLREMIY